MNEPASIGTPAGFFRRTGAMIYDSLLLFSVLFLATAVALPFNGGEPFRSGQIIYPLYLLAVTFLFFGWFWTHGGQTLGMQAWRIRVVGTANRAPDWAQATLRFLAALLSWGCLGLGFVWMLIDRRRRTWHDIISKTSIIREPQTSKRA